MVSCVDRTDRPVGNQGDTQQRGHQVHGRVVERGPGINCALGQQADQVGDIDGLGGNEFCELVLVGPESVSEPGRIDLGRQVTDGLQPLAFSQ